MGITRDTRHKRRNTGGKRSSICKKRKHELGRQPANTKIGPRRVTIVRVRGGNFKFRALRLDSGNFSWGSEGETRPARIVGVVYNATSNELVRTNTLVKGAIVQIDANPLKQWYEQYYGVTIGKRREDETEETKKVSERVKYKLRKRNQNRTLEPALEEQFKTGKLLARITTRPGQCGRADGYILEGEELAFYQKKIMEKKKK